MAMVPPSGIASTESYWFENSANGSMWMPVPCENS